MTFKTIPLRTKSRTYGIWVGLDCHKKLTGFISGKYSKIFIVTDGRLTTITGKIVSAAKKSKAQVYVKSVTAGENLKSLPEIDKIYGWLLQNGARRTSLIIAVGGGSVGDSIGFVASTYMRGLDWIGVPTTLLGQVDSSIGGKTAVNHAYGKNVIGSFHQPALVISDTGFLKSLKTREIHSGLGEALKYAITYDPSLFKYFQTYTSQILGFNDKYLTEIVCRSARWKAQAVSKDEFDKNGVREVLNFGHTFGHALETLTHYKTYQHGEAIVWGMIFATKLSVVLGWLPIKTSETILEGLRAIPIPSLQKGISISRYLKLMQKDKKVLKSKYRFVLLKGLGRTAICESVTDGNVIQVLKDMGV